MTNRSKALSFTLAPRYYDYQLKAEHRRPGSRDRFSIALFGSADQVEFVLPNPTLDPEGRSKFETFLAYTRLVVNGESKTTRLMVGK